MESYHSDASRIPFPHRITDVLVVSTSYSITWTYLSSNPFHLSRSCATDAHKKGSLTWQAVATNSTRSSRQRLVG
eukprot:1555670-Karenia_brevis.AAC.1